FVPSRVAVDLFAQQPMHTDVSLTDFPTEIDTVRVLAMRPRLATSPGSFEHRRRLGYGTFLDAEQIERRAPQQFSDLLRSTRGVQVSADGVSSSRILMEGNGPNALCEPLLVLDGQRVPLNGMNINDLIPSHIVRAVEIYPRRMEAPPEFQTIECGTIVVWTGARGWLAKRNKNPPPKSKTKS
ncbi:MAG: Plug domain-containing protein, partial [Gemmatimonadaceae bacterium]